MFLFGRNKLDELSGEASPTSLVFFFPQPLERIIIAVPGHPFVVDTDILSIMKILNVFRYLT